MKTKVSNNWLLKNDVYTSVTDLHIGELSEGCVWKINTGDPDQYFLLTNHQKISPYEQNWPGTGLMIWHINENGLEHTNRAPRIDIEQAYGLWDWHFGNVPGDTFPVASNPITGLDSFDIGGFTADGVFYGIYGGYLTKIVGGPHDFFPGPENEHTAFTPITNPSSNLYDLTDPAQPENISSGVKITNIRKDPASNDMIIDIDMSEVPPTPPTGVYTKISPWPYTVTVSWSQNPEPDVVYYEVWREIILLNGTISMQCIGTTTGTSLVDNNVQSGRKYNYFIKAIDSDLNFSKFSQKASAVIPVFISNPTATGYNSGRKLCRMPQDGNYGLCFADNEEADVLITDSVMSNPKYLVLGPGDQPTLSVSQAKIPPTIFNVAAVYNNAEPWTLKIHAKLFGYRQA